MNFGVIFNERDEEARELAVALGSRPDCKVAFPSSANDGYSGVDLLVVLGGDGTFLRGARLVAPAGIPILGVDMGTLGFLATVPPDGLDEALNAIGRGDFHIEERVMLDVSARRGETLLAQAFALNDGVVGRGHSGRMVELSVTVDGTPVATYAADGFIVATPTGSTAYSLAAGAPVLSPEVTAFVLVPICPHALTARPLVVSDNRTVRLSVRPRSEGAILAVDGEAQVFALLAGDEVVIRKAPFRARLVRIGAEDFFSRLRRKLQWGDRGQIVK